ncbi:hypothetical protein HFP15_33710 [Amycolatopsis sp. K13G38]|uniref:Phosphatidate cytidylyltransferase n=1 Tax=Amycolatopsis acididurans TaxID=2724524 RepID=A0ABX1JEG2_9PSEU|nr:hypothetical protein [Amycolatopsis acididurans]NKQ57829.1 hypothetical protein [Amycolatopsis acididurans]
MPPKEPAPIFALVALVLGIVAAASNGDAWWLLAGLFGFIFLAEKPAGPSAM